MNSDQMSDYRRGIWSLIYMGYSPKKLLKVLQIIVKEIEEDNHLKNAVEYYKTTGQ